MAIASKILLGERRKQIETLIVDKPYEALTVASGLLNDHGDDEDVVALYIRTAVRVGAKSSSFVVGERFCDLAGDVARDRFMSPEFCALNFAAKVVAGKDLKDEDTVMLTKAFKMNPSVTSEILEDIMGVMNDSHKTVVKKIVSGRS